MRPGLAHFLSKSRRIVAVLALLPLVGTSALELIACRGGSPAGRPAGPARGACPSGEVRSGCPCPPPLEPFAGACADRAVIAAACGPRPELPGAVPCAPIECGRGEAFDPLKGICIPPRELADQPEVAWLGLHEGEKLVCTEGVLEVSQGRVGCRPATLCRSRTMWNGKACTKPVPCEVGYFRDIAGCKPFTAEGAVDLPTWAKKVLEPAICPLLPVSSNPENFRILLDAPGNALAHLSIAVEATTDVPLVRRAAEAHAEALRSLQGDVTTTHADITVTCVGRAFPSPKVEVPDAGP